MKTSQEATRSRPSWEIEQYWLQRERPPGFLNVWPAKVGRLRGNGEVCYQGVQESFTMHWVRGGAGVFHLGGREFPLARGDWFAIWPKTIFHYAEAPGSPMDLSFVQIEGVAAGAFLEFCGLGPQTPVARTRDLERSGTLLDRLLVLFRRQTISEVLECAVLLHRVPELCRELTDETPGHKDLLAMALRVIESEASVGINVNELARELGVSRATLHRRFRARLDASPSKMLVQARLRHVKRLLTATSQPAKAIARLAGFQSENYFFNWFRSNTGSTPEAFRSLKKASRSKGDHPSKTKFAGPVRVTSPKLSPAACVNPTSGESPPRSANENG